MLATKKCSTKSLSRKPPCTPLPPRFCTRYSVSGIRLMNPSCVIVTTFCSSTIRSSEVDVAVVVGDLGAAVVAVLRGHLRQVVADDRVDVRVVGQQRLVAADLVAELRVLLQDFVAFERRELAELQPHDGLGLRPRSCWYSADARRVRARSAANARRRRWPAPSGAAGTAMPCSRSFASVRLGDVRQMRMTSFDVGDGDELAFEDVPAALRLAQQELGPPADDLRRGGRGTSAASP